MAKNLSDLSVLEVSLVPKPANQKEFLLFKSQGGGEKMGKDFLNKLKNKIPSDLNSNLSDDAENAIVASIKMLNDYMEELPEPFVNELMDLVGGPEIAKQLLEPIEDEEIENIEEIQMEKAEMSKIPDTVKKQVEELFKSHTELIKEKEDILKELNDVRTKQKEREYINKAKEFKKIPIEPEKFGLVLKNIAENSKEDYEEITRVLKAIDELALNSDSFSEYGSSISDEGGSNAWAKIQKLADNLVQKDTSLTKQKAINKVLELNPELYQEYLNEQ